jgi:phosphopantothenoylcysteine decarboxylase / phosphopantothenate---cysteine ligase
VIAKMACGIADDMLTCTALATRAPIVIAPAMNDNMWSNPVTQENVAKLKKHGVTFISPAYGRLASGKMGLGRLAELDEIYGITLKVLGKTGDLALKHIVVTAGGTQEPVDPVRCLTNRSTGKMGYAIAEAARNRGADVTLISGPTALIKPAGIKVIDVKTAEEMLQAVLEATKKTDALIMSAAVADFRPANPSGKKIKRQALSDLTLQLEKTTDILGQAKGDFIRVGFAAESHNVVDNAADKVKRKGLDLIVANDITARDCGFGTETNKVTIIDSKGKVDELPLMPKSEVADKILDRVAGLMKKSK